MAVTYPGLTVVGGTIITAVWGNLVRDGLYIPYTDETERDTYITSPQEGMGAYAKDINRHSWYNGSRWCPWPGQIIARGNRTSSSTTTTTEVGVLRLDSVSLKQGQEYHIHTNPLLLNSTVSGDYVFARLRYSTAGSATTASTTLVTMTGTTGCGHPIVPMFARYTPGSDVTFSVLLSVGRYCGTGTVGIAITASAPEMDMAIVAAGTSPADTGVDI